MRDLTTLITIMAAVYHESGRPSVASGHTLAHAVGQARPFTEFTGLSADARRGRELTAERLLERFDFHNFDYSAPAIDMEDVARGIHEAEREAVDRGWTVVKLAPPRPWIAFDDLPEQAQEGRRNQARYFLERFIVVPRS
jgi:hypothetical protein